MKVYLLLSLFLTITAYAKEPAYSPGVYRVESDHSKIDFIIPSSNAEADTYSFMKGNIKLKENFAESEIDAEVESTSTHFGKVNFRNLKFLGTLSQFELVGEIVIKGIVKKISFDTVYLGQVSDGLGKVKAAFMGKARIRPGEFGVSLSRIPEEVEVDLKILATRPTEMNIEFINSVLEISKLDY